MAVWPVPLPLDKTFDERERGVGALPPAAVDRQRVPAIGHLDDLGNTRIVLLSRELRLPTEPCCPSRPIW